MTPILELPVQLFRKQNWICWLSIKGEGKHVRLPGGNWTGKPLGIQPKPHKPPINPRTGNAASVDEAASWGTLQEAQAGVQRWGASGLGFVLTLELGIVFIDLDDCRNPQTGKIAPWALEIVRDLNTYTEISPNGTGLHLLAYGEKPGDRCKKKYEGGGVEMYSTRHYSTMTGQHLDGTPCNIETRPAEITALYRKVFGSELKATVLNREPQPVSIDDEALLAKIRASAQGQTFGQLWAGDTSDYGGDHSSADAALCSILAFWTGRDANRIDSLFRQSGLMRDKWNRDDYRERTIHFAIENCTEVYQPNGASSQQLGGRQPANGNYAYAKLQTAAEICQPNAEAQSSPPRNTQNLLLREALKKPPPLAEAAFYGIAGEFVRIVGPESESDPAALLIQFLVAAGIFLGRSAYFEVEGTRHYTNLFAVVCGETSQGRKGTAWGRARSCFDKASASFSADCFTSGLSSGEGLIFSVRNAITEIKFKKGGTEGQCVIVDEGVTDKRLCVVEGEFSRVLKVAGGQANILSDVLRDAWDTGNLNNLTKNNRNKATGAHIGIIGHITQAELTRLLTNTEAANGFGNRFLWLWASRSKSLPEGGNLSDDALDGIREGLVAAADSIYPGQPATCRDADAKDLWHQVYPSLSEGRPGLVGAITGRAAPQVMRLALIFAALDCKRVISLAHLQAALAIWEYCAASARFIFGESLGDDTADAIWQYLQSLGPAGATRTDISKLFGKNKPRVEIDRSLAVLARHDLIRGPVFQETGGIRPAERWFAV